MSRGDGYNFEYDDDAFEMKNKKGQTQRLKVKGQTPFNENAYEDVGNSPDGIKSIYCFINYTTAKDA